MIQCTLESGRETSLRHVTIDTIVLKDHQIILVKRADRFLEGGKWGLIGGFVDRDENLKQAVEREVMEETGYKVKNITLLTIRDNPDRPHEDRQNFSFVFFCEALELTGNPDSESTEQKWFSLDDLPQKEEIAFDHFEDIQLYLRYKKDDLNIPILP